MNFESISFSKLKQLREYDDADFLIVTHVIYLNIWIKKYKQFTILMFVANFENHEIILNKFWMNWYGLLLNIKNDNLIFFQETLSTSIETSNDLTIFNSTIIDLNIFIFNLEKVQILSQRWSSSIEQSFLIHNVNAKSFE